MSQIKMRVELVTGSALEFEPREALYAVDPNRDIEHAIDKLDQGYKALRMWLVMQLPPQDQARYNQVQPARCRCPQGGYPAPEVRKADLPKAGKLGPPPGTSR